MQKMMDADYFALEALSNSGVCQLLKTPAHFILPVQDSPAMQFGRLVHCMVLEPTETSKRFACAPQVDRRTKAGKEEWEAFCKASEDMQVVSKEDWDLAEKVSKAVLDHRFHGTTIRDFLNHPATKKEVAIVWDHEFEDIGTIPCKCKIDAINKEYGVILDLKTARDASPDGFRRAMYSERDGYYLQSAFYRMPKETQGFQFLFLAVEKVEPFCTGLYRVDDHCLEEAYEKIREAAEIYQHGMETGEWSSQYNESPEEIIPPGWFWMKQS